MTAPDPPPDDGYTYGPGSLGSLRAAGVTLLRFHCVGTRCRYWTWKRVDELIGSGLEPGTTLVMLAHRARCASCGRRGCHVGLGDPPVSGQPGYPDWVQGERERCKAFLAKTERL